METAMEIYTDFFNYRSGIYSHTTGSYAGGHAIKIIGYGVENVTQYWICANSWGPQWGENGFFRIPIGSNGVDTAYACTPETNLKSEIDQIFFTQ